MAEREWTGGGRCPATDYAEGARYLMRFIGCPADYADWQPITHHMHDCGLTEEEVDRWCEGGAGYEPGCLSKHWRSYGAPTDSDAAYGALVNLAKANPDYVPYRGEGPCLRASSQGSGARTADRQAPKAAPQGLRGSGAGYPALRARTDPAALSDVAAAYAMAEDVIIEGSGFLREDQFRNQLDAMGFTDGETVAVCSDPANPSTYRFMDAGEARRRAADVVEEYAYLCINPLDGTGRKAKANVTDYRNLLVECDPDAWEDKDAAHRVAELAGQVAAAEAVGLPSTCVTYSGHKSIHFIVAVDAADLADYEAKARWTYGVLKAGGFDQLDANCKNPDRWTRIAGADRGGTVQALIAAYDRGVATWEGWRRDVVWSDLMDRAGAPDLDALKRGYLAPPPVTGTGIRPLDRWLMGGMRPGIHVLMGTPGAGKSSLALQVAVNVAAKGGRVAVVSAEMTVQECAARVCSSLSLKHAGGVEPFKWSDWERMGRRGDPSGTEALDVMGDLLPGLMFVDDGPAVGEAGVCDLIREAGAAGCSLVVVDYLQRIRPADPAANQFDGVSAVVRSLTAAAKAGGVPVLLVSSMNREAQKRDGEGVTLTGGRGTGDIEYDAKSVWMLRNVLDAPGDHATRDVSLYVAKARNGHSSLTSPCCTLAFAPAYNALEEVTRPLDVPEDRERAEGGAADRDATAED